MSSSPGDNRYTERLKKFGEKLDEISPHFCAAKWLQVTLHLQIGHNHSCHHVRTHPIPKECVDDPSLLHNTPYKKEIWKRIMNGEIISECDYCNNIEKISPKDKIL